MKLSVCFIAAWLSVPSIAAHADDLFTLTNATSTLTFSLPASPGPTYSYGANYFEIGTTLYGNNTSLGYSIVEFYSSGGLVVRQGGQNVANGVYGPLLFSGSTASPTFLPGTYSNLHSDAGYDGTYPGPFKLAISNTTAVTPEPSGMALAVTGALGIVGCLRRRMTLSGRAPA